MNFIYRQSLFFLYAVAAFFSAARAEPPVIPGDELLTYFSSSCETQGNWIETARGQTESLINSLKLIQSDPHCKNAGEIISQIGIFRQRILDLQKWNQGTMALDKYQAQEQEILLQISKASQDQGTKSLLEDSLRSIQLDIASLRSQNDSAQKYDNLIHAAILADTVITAETLLRQAILNQECLIKQPTLLTSIASLSGTIASAASLSNPALSLGLASGTEMLGIFIGYFRSGRISRTIRNANLTNVGSAFQCVLESLSNQYCRATDALKLIKLKASFAQSKTNELGTAVRYIDREIPAFIQWLDKVRFGTLPTTSQDAERANAVLFEQISLQAIKRSGIGILEENRTFYNTAQSEREKFTIIKTIIPELIGFGGNSMNGGSRFVSQTLLSQISFEFLPYYLMGFTNAAQVPVSFGTNLISFREFDPYQNESQRKQLVGFAPPSLDRIKEIFISWVDDAVLKVDRRLTLILQTDPLLVVAEARDPTSGQWKISAETSLTNLITFLEVNPIIAQNHDGAFDAIYKDTTTILRDILALIQNQTLQKHEIIAKVYERAQLGFGVAYLQNRLELLIRRAIFEKYSARTGENEAAQVLASNRFLDAISSVRGTASLTHLYSDIQKSIPLTISTIEAFSDFFAKNIVEILQHYISKENQARIQKDQTLLETHERSRAELCFGLLSVPLWPAQIPRSLCQGLQLKSIIPSGPSSQIITDNLMSSAHEKRACEFMDYFRISKIFQEWDR